MNTYCEPDSGADLLRLHHLHFTSESFEHNPRCFCEDISKVNLVMCTLTYWMACSLQGILSDGIAEKWWEEKQYWSMLLRACLALLPLTPLSMFPSCCDVNCSASPCPSPHHEGVMSLNPEPQTSPTNVKWLVIGLGLVTVKSGSYSA